MSYLNAFFFCWLLTNVPVPERMSELRKFECGTDLKHEITVNSGDLIQISAKGATVSEGKIDNLKVEISKRDSTKVQCLGAWSVPEVDESGRRIVGGLGMIEMVTLIKTSEPGTAVVKVTTAGKDVQGNTFEFNVIIKPAQP